MSQVYVRTFTTYTNVDELPRYQGIADKINKMKLLPDFPITVQRSEDNQNIHFIVPKGLNGNECDALEKIITGVESLTA
jgi:hypothetical protein